VTPSDIVTPVSKVQPLKAESPILLTLLGITIFSRDLQPLKAELPIVSAPYGISMFTKEVHPLKALSIIRQIGSVIVTLRIDLYEDGNIEESV
jgi:hypothetical protein